MLEVGPASDRQVCGCAAQQPSPAAGTDPLPRSRSGHYQSGHRTTCRNKHAQSYDANIKSQLYESYETG